MTTKYDILFKTLLSGSTLNAMAASLISFSMGSIIGTAIFLVALFLGTWNKYRSLRNDPDARLTTRLRFLRDPALTAKILLCAASLNMMCAIGDIIQYGVGEHGANIWMAVLWLFGVLGDYVLIRLDNANYKGQKIQKHALIALLMNPALYYKICTMIVAIILVQKVMIGSLEFIIGWGIIITILMTIIYTALQTIIALKRKQSKTSGHINIISGLASIGMAILAVTTADYAICVAQSLFALSSLRTLYEAKSALEVTEKPSGVREST